jgi:GGDEF domain-containing protein
MCSVGVIAYIDHSKKVNDEHGDKQGNVMLREVAEVFSTQSTQNGAGVQEF